jgi:hypothetical protein
MKPGWFVGDGHRRIPEILIFSSSSLAFAYARSRSLRRLARPDADPAPAPEVSSKVSMGRCPEVFFSAPDFSDLSLDSSSL